MGHVTRGHITNANWQKQQHWGGAFWHVSELKNSIHGGSNKWLKIFFNFVTMGHVTQGQINPRSITVNHKNACICSYIASFYVL